MFLSSISDTRQKVHFQKTHRICFLYPFSSLLQKWWTGRAQEDTTEPQRSPLLSSPRPLRSSEQSFDTHSFISLSLSLSLSLINYSKFTLIIEYCVSQMMMVFPYSQGSLILILLHSVVGTPLFHSPHFFPINFFEMF